MTRDMTKGNIFRHMLFYSIPLLAGNVFHQLYNTVDSVIVGSVNGKEALAAIGAAGPVMNILLFLIVGISMGSSILMSGYYGAGKLDLLKAQLMTSLLGSLAFTVFLSLFSFLGSEMFLVWIQTPQILLPEAISYLRIISAGLVFSCIYNILAAGLRAVGNSTAPLFSLVISSVVNILLDLFLVGRLGMGIRGAAYGTVISQAVSAVFLAVYLSVKVPFLRFSARELAWELSMLKKTIRFSSVSAAQQTVLYVGRILVQAAVNTQGVDAVAAFNVTCIIDNYVMTVFCNSFQGLFRGLGQLKATLAATLIQIPVRVIISYCLIGRLGIRAVAAGIMTGWAFMIIYQVSQCRKNQALSGFFRWRRRGCIITKS